jgi:hypothetical protein
MNPSTASLALLLILSACTTPAASPSPVAATPAKPQAAAAVAPAVAAPKPVVAPAEITEARGVDLSRLSDPQKTSFFQILNSETSACAKPHSLAVSLRDDAACRDSLVVSQYIADALASGAAADDIKRSVEPLVDTCARARSTPRAGRSAATRRRR